MSTYFVANDSMNLGYRPDSRSNIFDNSSTNDYTQANSLRTTVKIPNEDNYSALVKTENNTSWIFKQSFNLRPSNPEDFRISQNTFNGMNIGYLQNQNISIISKSDLLAESQIDARITKEDWQRDTSFWNSKLSVHQPQSCQNKYPQESMYLKTMTRGK